MGAGTPVHHVATAAFAPYKLTLTIHDASEADDVTSVRVDLTETLEEAHSALVRNEVERFVRVHVAQVDSLTPFPRRDMAPLRRLAMVEPSVARERV